MRRIPWRALLARLPLPTLALSASYGVWSFQSLFLPHAFALISAAAFEIVYIGLSAARLHAAQRRRATHIARAAVAVSVLYNVAAGLFHRRPELLIAAPLWLDALLAVMHGLPLAVVAYAVASLLLHEEAQDASLAAPAPIDAVLERMESEYRCDHCGAALEGRAQWMNMRRWARCAHCAPRGNGKAEALQDGEAVG